MQFRWIEWNVDKVMSHGVWPEAAEQVVNGATSPYPQARGYGKFLVWGPTAAGRFLQVVYVAAEDECAFVIHARPLTEKEKWRWRRQHRRRRRRRRS